MSESSLPVSSEQSEQKKKVDKDLWIIIIATMAAFGLFIGFQKDFYSFIRNGQYPILLRTLTAALFQFGIAGFGIVIVMIYRRESFRFHRLVTKNTLVSLLLSFAVFIPYIVFIILSGRFNGYKPLSIMLTDEILLSPVPVNVIGMLIIALCWGFFEGFNYVVISNKINERYPSGNRFLNWGALGCTLMCILIHGLIGVTPEAIIELICVSIIIYGMILIKDAYKNSWGIIMIFLFLWNAF